MYFAKSKTESAKTATAFLTRMRFLVYRFRPDVWWWGSVFNVRQLLLAFAPMVQPDDPNTQLIFVSIVLQVYLALVCIFWPWKTHEINVLDILSSVLLLTVVITVNSFMPPSEWKGDHEVVMWFFLASVFAVNIFMIGFLVFQLFRKGPSGLFGNRYPYRKTVEEFAAELRTMSFKIATTEEASLVTWLKKMNDFDRRAIDKYIAVSQSYAIDGARTLVSRTCPPRLVLDEVEVREVGLEDEPPCVLSGSKTFILI
mmetsp:Transcript_151963/g.487788  ORF Transcript_151963/g.487788 Transcript_151963/m.487788 type:complete len:256 (-) Transcript_151963:214-981(-)